MDGMTPTRYAVIGSNCFTGSHLVAALLDSGRNTVLAVSRSPEYPELFLPYLPCKNGPSGPERGEFRFQQIDFVRDFERLARLLDEARPEVVIHVAALSEVALSIERPVEYFATNTLAVVKLTDHLRKCSYLKRYLHISSAEIFGSCSGPIDESAPFRPSTPYAVSKAAADLHLNTMIQNHGFPATLIRSTNVYGKHQQLWKIIPRSIIYLKQGRTIDLHGGGRAVKSFIHVRDVVAGLLRAIEEERSGTFHFSDPNDRTVADVVRPLSERMGRRFESATRVVEERKAQDARYWLDCSRAERELGWSPRVSFEEGIAEVQRWIDDHWEQIRRLPQEYRHQV
jgi:dTDP-glucose 4,6-dehydratase